MIEFTVNKSEEGSPLQDTSNEEFQQQCAEENCLPIYGVGNLLVFDLDLKEGRPENFLRLKSFDEKLNKACGELGISTREVKKWVSKSGNGIHAIAAIDTNLTFHERLLIQMYCGSDPLKELLSMVRLRKIKVERTALMKPKEEWNCTYKLIDKADDIEVPF